MFEENSDAGKRFIFHFDTLGLLELDGLGEPCTCKTVPMDD